MISVMLMLVISSFMIVKHTHHHCTGNNCPVCQEIIQCLNNIRLLGFTGNGSVSSNSFVIGFMVTLLLSASTVTNKTTLFSLKVELLN